MTVKLNMAAFKVLMDDYMPRIRRNANSQAYNNRSKQQQITDFTVHMYSINENIYSVKRGFQIGILYRFSRHKKALDSIGSDQSRAIGFSSFFCGTNEKGIEKVASYTYIDEVLKTSIKPVTWVWIVSLSFAAIALLISVEGYAP